MKCRIPRLLCRIACFCVALVPMRHLYIKIVTCILVYVMMNSPQKHNSRVILSKLFYNFAS